MFNHMSALEYFVVSSDMYLSCIQYVFKPSPLVLGHLESTVCFKSAVCNIYCEQCYRKID